MYPTSKNIPKRVSGIGLPDALEASTTRCEVWLALALALHDLNAIEANIIMRW